MTFKRMATYAAVSSAAGLAALFLGNGVAAADPAAPVPPHEPGVVAAGERPPPEERQEEPKKTDCAPWCEVIEAAKQLPPPDFSGVEVPKLAEVNVPVSAGLGLPDVVPDIGFPIAFPTPQFPSLGEMPKLQLPPAPKLQFPPAPKFPKFDLTKLGQLPF